MGISTGCGLLNWSKRQVLLAVQDNDMSSAVDHTLCWRCRSKHSGRWSTKHCSAKCHSWSSGFGLSLRQHNVSNVQWHSSSLYWMKKPLQTIGAGAAIVYMMCDVWWQSSGRTGNTLITVPVVKTVMTSSHVLLWWECGEKIFSNEIMDPVPY